jgi:transcriptional regulator with XRE-family HTH domain
MRGLTELRESKGVLKAHVAYALSMGPSNYKRIEESNQRLSFSKLKAIREFLGYSVKDFYTALEKSESDK